MQDMAACGWANTARFRERNVRWGWESKCYRICANAFGCNEKKVITEPLAVPNSFMQW